MPNRILIVDDKKKNEDFSSINALGALTSKQKELVDFEATTKLLWKNTNNGDDVELLQDFATYAFIFIHKSFRQLGIHERLLSNLITKLSVTSTIVLITGSHQESSTPIVAWINSLISSNTRYFTILRRQYYYNLGNFVNSKLLNDSFQIDYLYDSNKKPEMDKANALLKAIEVKLEESITVAINDPVFGELLNLLGYNDNAIELAKKKFETLSAGKVMSDLSFLIKDNL